MLTAVGAFLASASMCRERIRALYLSLLNAAGHFSFSSCSSEDKRREAKPRVSSGLRSSTDIHLTSAKNSLPGVSQKFCIQLVSGLPPARSPATAVCNSECRSGLPSTDGTTQKIRKSNNSMISPVVCHVSLPSSLITMSSWLNGMTSGCSVMLALAPSLLHSNLLLHGNKTKTPSDAVGDPPHYCFGFRAWCANRKRQRTGTMAPKGRKGSETLVQAVMVACCLTTSSSFGLGFRAVSRTPLSRVVRTRGVHAAPWALLRAGCRREGQAGVSSVQLSSVHTWYARENA